MNVRDRLEALAAAPKPWLVSVTYDSGKVRTLRQPREVMARNFAAREERNMGRIVIDRETGENVKVIAVTVEHAPE